MLQPLRSILNQLLVRLLSLSAQELASWQASLIEAIGIDLLPLFLTLLHDDVRLALNLGSLGPAGSKGRKHHSNKHTDTLPAAYRDATFAAVRRVLALFTVKDDSLPSTSQARYRPLVLLIDDVQWASADDLEFYEQILTPTTSSAATGMLLVFVFRVETGSNAFMNSSFRQRLCKLPFSLETTPFETEHIEGILEGITGMQNSLGLHELAVYLHQQSLGNQNHVRNLLSDMHTQKQLWWNWDILRWEWEIHGTSQQTNSSTQGAAELLDSLLRGERASDWRRIVFAAAATAISGTFSCTIVALATQMESQEVTAVIKDLAVANKLFKCTSMVSLGFRSPPKPLPSGASENIIIDKWSFSHDQIQSAALLLLAEQQRAAAHWQIGTILLQRTAASEQNIEIALNNLNEAYLRGHRASNEESELLCRLNLQYGRETVRPCSTDDTQTNRFIAVTESWRPRCIKTRSSG